MFKLVKKLKILNNLLKRRNYFYTFFNFFTTLKITKFSILFLPIKQLRLILKFICSIINKSKKTASNFLKESSGATEQYINHSPCSKFLQN